MDVTRDDTEPLAAENERLRARVAELEDQLAEQAARTAEAVARAQDRIYWLDRWHIDLDSLMRRPGAGAITALVDGLRRVRHRLQRLRRRLVG